MNTLGQRLKYAREYRGYSQKDLEIISGVKQGTISKIERGKQESSAHDVVLCRALEINPFWLVFREGDMEMPKGFFPQAKAAKLDTHAPSIDNLVHRAEILAATELKKLANVNERLERIEKTTKEFIENSNARYTELERAVAELSVNKPPKSAPKQNRKH